MHDPRFLRRIFVRQSKHILEWSAPPYFCPPSQSSHDGTHCEKAAAFKVSSCMSGCGQPQQTRWHLPMDEAKIDDWLVEDILDLLNDALGG